MSNPSFGTAIALTIFLVNWWAYALPIPEDAPSAPLSPNVIIIEGKQRESRRPQRAGQSLVMRPTDETRYDSKTLLKSEANLTLPETGKTTASGFSVPRVRGQDARLTDIYLEGLRIQDPYLGYPVIDDLDLRACGEMTLYVGNTPPTIPSVNPNGVLSYRVIDKKSTQQIGTAVGTPYGSSVWALSQIATEQEANQSHQSVRIYMREHWTKGEFAFYDDNLTPYNPNDDRYRIRKHADRNAEQLLPSFSWQRGGHRLSGIGLWNRSQTSIPARMTGVDSQARERSMHRLSRLAYSYSFASKNPIHPTTAGLELGYYDDDIFLSDPSNAVLGQSQSNRRKLNAKVASANGEWTYFFSQERPTTLYLKGETSQGKINAASSREPGFQVTRLQKTVYAGFETPIPKNLLVELKTQIQLQNDTLQEQGQPRLSRSPLQHKSQDTLIRGSSIGIAWQQATRTIYAQLARNERAPTLLEEFGDGGLIRDNPNLKSEQLLHREIGGQIRQKNLQFLFESMSLRAAMFFDSTTNRIVMLPSIAQTMRAQNSSHTQIRGIEFGTELSTKHLIANISYAKLDPLDISIPARTHQIPSVPSDVATASLGYNWNNIILRWSSRYQSQIWRDSENTIAIPSTTIHDASIDTTRGRLALGIAIYNIADQKKSAISAPDSHSNRGYTSYSDYAGMPLPGRHFRLNLTYEL